MFVSPTIQEPYGIASREAMMCGLPVVSTANGGVEDSIKPETGIVVPIHDPEVLAKAIMKIKKNLSKYEPEYIRSLVVQQCGKAVFLGKMYSFYGR